MNRSIEQALLSLLPTHNTTLPRQLVDLASSLLAQSRNRASTLKAEEEIARPYACAHIACDRLKIQLNLPPIEPRPPIPPRIYKRLYSHLDKILPNTAAGTPKARTPSSSSRALPSRATPTKDRSLSHFRSTPSKAPAAQAAGTPLSSTSRRHGNRSQALPRWVQPAARQLCNALGHAQLAPTVMAGMTTIAAPLGRRTADVWVNGHLWALLGAVYYWTSTQLAKQRGEPAADEVRYKIIERGILGELQRARAEITVAGSQEEEGGAAWDGWVDVDRQGFRDAVLEVQKRKWLESDWYLGIADLVRSGEADDGGDGGVQVDGEMEEEEIVRVRKADHMIQDRYDFLTERKREAYKRWKEGIVARVAEIQRERNDTMELDS